MKKLIFLCFLLIAGFVSRAQTDSGNNIPSFDSAKTTAPVIAPKPVKKTIVQKKKILTDTLQLRDSLTKAFVDSLPLKDSPIVILKPVIKPAIRKAIKHPIDSIYLKLLDNPFLRTTKKPVYLIIKERERESGDDVFYLLSGLLLFLAFIKLVFSKYFKNIFRLFFQPSFRQKQTREQLLQNNLPSLLLNLFFILSLSTYVSFIIQYYHLLTVNFWFLFLYAIAFFAALYLGKFIFLKFSGWVFNVQEATTTYLFVVYFVNKIAGVVLLPFIVLIAFSQPQIINISITISTLLIILLLIYRYLISYPFIHKEIQVNFLHILIYVCAFEILPLLLIYKTLIIFLNKML